MILDPIPLLCENNGAIAKAKEPRTHQKSKHILRRFHFIREIIARGDVVVERVPSTDNVADCTRVIGFSPCGRLIDIMWLISQSHFHVSYLCSLK